MEVYYNTNIMGNCASLDASFTNRRGERLRPLPVDRTFLWEGQEIFLPARYLGEAGAAADLCAKFSAEEMRAFLEKWNAPRRLSIKNPEDYEQIDAENPGSRNFTARIHLDAIPLKNAMSSSINWYPEEILRFEAHDTKEEWKNDTSAEILMEAYGCDRKSCWHFERIFYRWEEAPILSPTKVSLILCANPLTLSAGHFTTRNGMVIRLPDSLDYSVSADSLNSLDFSNSADSLNSLASSNISCSGQVLKVLHPVTGQEYLLTLQECRQTRHSFEDIGAEGIAGCMVYPEYNQILSYSIAPEIDRELFDIRDCGEADSPRPADAGETPGKADGPAAVFMAVKSPFPSGRAAVSALRFGPVEEVRWRTVFLVKPKEDAEFAFGLS